VKPHSSLQLGFAPTGESRTKFMMCVMWHKLRMPRESGLCRCHNCGQLPVT
jgi:hypothetical protein